MGGWGSGRRGGRPTVEACDTIRLDVNQVLRPAQRPLAGTEDEPKTVGPFRLTVTRSGEPKPWAVIRIVFELAEERGHADLLFDADHVSRPVSQQRQRIRVEATPCHLGGQRWWWACPATGRYCSKLYLPNGGHLFLSRGRRAYDLAYATQNETAIERSHMRLRRIHERLGADYRCLPDFPPKRPKWMRHRTYARLVAQWEVARDHHDELSIAGAQRLLRRLSPGGLEL
jgi:hypothetical protein